MAGSILSKVQDFIADRTGLRLLPDRLRHPRDPSVETLKVPGYYQAQQYTCGFVAGMMVLRYFDPDYPVERFYQRTTHEPIRQRDANWTGAAHKQRKQDPGLNSVSGCTTMPVLPPVTRGAGRWLRPRKEPVVR